MITILAYFGPDATFPIASSAAAAAGVVMLFGQRSAALLKFLCVGYPSVIVTEIRLSRRRPSPRSRLTIASSAH